MYCISKYKPKKSFFYTAKHVTPYMHLSHFTKTPTFATQYCKINGYHALLNTKYFQLMCVHKCKIVQVKISWLTGLQYIVS